MSCSKWLGLTCSSPTILLKSWVAWVSTHFWLSWTNWSQWSSKWALWCFTSSQRWQLSWCKVWSSWLKCSYWASRMPSLKRQKRVTSRRTRMTSSCTEMQATKPSHAWGKHWVWSKTSTVGSVMRRYSLPISQKLCVRRWSWTSYPFYPPITFATNLNCSKSFA